MARKTQVSTFADYLASAGDLPSDSFVGLLVMYSFGGARHADVTKAAVEGQFAAHGLDPNFVPADPTAVQAFKNATGDKQPGWTYQLGSSEFFAEIKHVGANRETITRVVWAYRVGDDRAHLDGREIGRLTFYKQDRDRPGSERVRFSLIDERLLDGERAELEAFLTRVHTDYEWYKTYLYDQPIRQMVMRYIEHRLNGIKVLTSGGCYFVHRSRWEELRHLADAVHGLAETFGLTLCPIPDLPDLRAMLIESFQNEIVTEVSGLTADIKDRTSGGRTLTAATVQRYSAEVRAIAARAEEHTRILEVSQDRTAGALESAWMVLGGVAAQVGT